MLLAVDTSTQWTGLALYDGSQVFGEIGWPTHSHHTVELAPAVDRLLKQGGFHAAQIECLGVALGPGSFTSLRIGLALVKGMALALHIPVVGIPTLDFLAAAQPVRELPMAALLQAGRGRLALVWYKPTRAAGRRRASPDHHSGRAGRADRIADPGGGRAQRGRTPGLWTQAPPGTAGIAGPSRAAAVLPGRTGLAALESRQDG